MARLARVVIPGMPHHITQRGNRRQPTFFCEEDYAAYLELMGQWCKERGVAVWAYCLMPNHVHLIAVPKSEDGLRRAIGKAHRRYTRRVNFREQWRGHLWQGRFASFVLDEPYLLAAARYVELNPVRAGLATCAERLSLEQCPGSPEGEGRLPGAGFAVVGDCGELASFARQRGERRATQGVPRARANGARAWRRRFSEAAGEETWPCFEAAETGPEEGLRTVVVYAVPGIP